ncbi:MAG: hypothetical protein JWO07_728 [Candidatus Saccharibacteria bacterium]|nr:hypothetical protein [Candidatus Saccharibacteria bacterium]
MKSITEQLLKKQQEEPEEYAFAALLADFADIKTYGDPDRLPPYAHNEADQLRVAVSGILSSNNPRDKQAAVDVPARFNRDDLPDAMNELRDLIPGERTDEWFNILKWLSSANDRNIALFALWNKLRRDELQRRLDDNLGEIQADSLEKAEYLMGEGIYPKGVEVQYHDTFKQYGQFKAMDTFESGLMHADGYANDDLIAVSNLFFRNRHLPLTDNLKNVAFHEYTHGIGAEHGFGFMNGIWYPEIMMRMVEEWAVTHLTNVASVTRHPTIDTTMPNVYDPGLRRVDKNPRYISEGRFFAAISDNTPGGIPVDLVGHAYVSAWSTKEGHRYRRDLETRIIRGLGSEATFFLLAEEYEDASTQNERNMILEREIARLRGTPFTHTEFVPVQSESVGALVYRETSSGN